MHTARSSTRSSGRNSYPSRSRTVRKFDRVKCLAIPESCVLGQSPSANVAWSYGRGCERYSVRESQAAKNRPHVEPSSKQQSWARQTGPWAYAGGVRKAAAQGVHAAPQRAPSDAVTIPRPRRRNSFDLERGQGCPRPRRSRDRGIFDRGTLLRSFDALRHGRGLRPADAKLVPPILCRERPGGFCAPSSNLMQNQFSYITGIPGSDGVGSTGSQPRRCARSRRRIEW